MIALAHAQVWELICDGRQVPVRGYDLRETRAAGELFIKVIAHNWRKPGLTPLTEDLGKLSLLACATG